VQDGNQKSLGIQDQLDLEIRMIDSGISKFNSEVSKAEKSDRGDETGYAQRLMKDLIGPLADEIKKYTHKTGPGNDVKTRRLLKQIKPEQASYFILKSIFQHLIAGKTITSVCSNAGRFVEDELKFKLFHDTYGDYYTAIVKDFKRKGTKNYQHIHRVLTKKSNEKNLGWQKWTDKQRVGVGLSLLRILLDTTDLVHKHTAQVQKRKKIVTLIPTETALNWIREYNSHMSLLKPNVLPCIIEPDPWVGLHQGGFYSPQLRSNVPLVKTRSKAHRDLLEPAHLKNMCTAVNQVQNTPWKVNIEVLEVLKKVWELNLGIGIPNCEPIMIPDAPVPKEVKQKDMTVAQQELFKKWRHEASNLYTQETQRVSKCLQVLRVLQMATEYQAYSKFWYVYSCDFRGRIYCSVGSFSPQGPDYARATLLFANGKRLGHSGAYWLKIHGANCYGIDKVSYEDRIRWVQEHRQHILDIANDPIGSRSAWAEADKPWQFLAFCFEYKKYTEQGDDLISYLPISVDGSCNGLQNFSAMLRDRIGGSATNLLPGLVPSDIYTEVGKVCLAKLKAVSTEPEAQKALRFIDKYHEGQIPRGISKKPVMTLPYGSTKHSCTDSIYDFLTEEHKENISQEDRFKMAVYLTPLLWASIGEVVIAAREAMGWLQSCTDLLSKQGKPCVWVTPLGFLVYQGTVKNSLSRIQTTIFGTIHYRLVVATPTSKLDPQRQKQGVAANFIHSMDACHLMATIIELGHSGIKDVVCVHDEYGTHASDMDELQYILRQIFVKMYTNNNVLEQFKVTNELNSDIVLPDIPSMGDLSLIDVLESKYFFC